MTLEQWLEKYSGKPSVLRLGQRFVVEIGIKTFPSLFYERNEIRATSMIRQYCQDVQITDHLPIICNTEED